MAFWYKKNIDGTLTVKDPIYGTISIPYPFSKIILSKEMLRLENISQNGFSQYEYKNLENNDRLSHSVGAFYVMTLILERLELVLAQYDIHICKDDKDIALCSMLLHDIGHGPFSHSLEGITHYSHEKRTTDILLGNTEIHHLLVELYGQKKLRQIASFIAEIQEQEELGKASFTKLLKNLVSHQLDADRIDYLLRDTYYIGLSSSIQLDKMISNLSVIVNHNQEYELVILRKGLACIENVLIQRYQMYRDVYLSEFSVLGDAVFQLILERFRSNSVLHSLPVSDSFRILADDPAVLDLDDFLKMKDSDFKYAFQVLMENDKDPVVAYLSNVDNLKDYVLIKNHVSGDKIKRYLREIFGNWELFSNTLSVIQIQKKNRLYKREQGLRVQDGNQVLDLTECTNLIHPQEILENTYVFFNPVILKLELGFRDEEFNKYESEVKKMIESLNKNPEEFELKYIVSDEEESNLLERMMTLFTEHGFKIVSVMETLNEDEYFDSKNLDLYQKGGSLRIRQSTKKGKKKLKGTYKMPLGEGEVYSSRTEIEEGLSSMNFCDFVSKMQESRVPLDFQTVVPYPIIHSKTKRKDVVLEKNGVSVCLSLDYSTYLNYFLNNLIVTDKMIEIEAIGELNNRIILNEIHQFITEEFSGLKINKESKYERGIYRTLKEYRGLNKEEYEGNLEQSICPIVKKLSQLK